MGTTLDCVLALGGKKIDGDVVDTYCVATGQECNSDCRLCPHERSGKTLMRHKWPTVQQLKADRGRSPDSSDYPTGSAVYARMEDWGYWKATTYGESQQVGYDYVVCACTLWGCPPMGWAPKSQTNAKTNGWARVSDTTWEKLFEIHVLLCDEKTVLSNCLCASGVSEIIRMEGTYTQNNIELPLQRLGLTHNRNTGAVSHVMTGLGKKTKIDISMKLTVISRDENPPS